MSIPEIPWSIERRLPASLGDLWARPDGDFPDELWPHRVLRAVVPEPTGWLTVSEHFFTGEGHGGTGCVLVHPDDISGALANVSWSGHDLGTASVWEGPSGSEFDSGLACVEQDVWLEFFAQARMPAGSRLPVVDVSQPFLWYWDAFSVPDGLRYLNHAGRERDLVRWVLGREHWRVEVRALEFRQFLAACGRAALLQVDHVPTTVADDFERTDAEYTADGLAAL